MFTPATCGSILIILNNVPSNNIATMCDQCDICVTQYVFSQRQQAMYFSMIFYYLEFGLI